MLYHLRARGPILAGFLLVFLGIFVGEYFSLYYRIPYFDKLLHVSGGAIAAWFALTILKNDLASLCWWKRLFIIVSVAVFLGVIWEWAEFAANSTRTSAPWLYHYFHGGDLADTMGDLIADTIGALLVSAWALYRKKMVSE